jgi:glycosyltransferase involved in cell wall biosynthesis
MGGHSNYWESREIAHIFARLGFSVDAVAWDNLAFYPEREDYSVLFDIAINLQRWAPLFPPSVRKLMHITGSYWHYSFQAEMARIEALHERRSALYAPKRTVLYPELHELSIAQADACTLIGNQHTLETFPEKYRSKIKTVPVSASPVLRPKQVGNYVPQDRGFLWFFGSGAVHKGLDLVLEVFAGTPQLALHVVGNVFSEPDFVRIYRKELLETSNIHYHGFLPARSRAFADVLDRCFCFIAPSCSEAISSAVVTCLQAGLLPILSRDVGVTLPTDCGVTLESCDIDTVREAVLSCCALPDEAVERQISATQDLGIKAFSRKSFSRAMEAALRAVLYLVPARNDG